MEDFEDSKGAVKFDLLCKFAQELEWRNRLGLSIPLLFLTEREMTEQELRGILKVLQIDLTDPEQVAYCQGMFSALQGAGIFNITELFLDSLVDESNPYFLDGLTLQTYQDYKAELEQESKVLLPFFSD